MAKAQTDNYPVPMPIPEKPLNQAQVKNLEKLVEGDFTDLAEQVFAEIDNHLQKRLKAIADKYGDDSRLQVAKETAISLQREMEDQLRQFQTNLAAEGIVHTGHRSYDPFYAITINANGLQMAGKEEAETKAQNAASRLKSTARRVLNQRQRAVQREVLLQGVGAIGALDLINDLPNALDIIEQVKLEMAATHEDDIKELIG